MIRVFQILVIVFILTLGSCKKSNTCTSTKWFIDVTDHPLVNGHCVDNNTQLMIKCSEVRSITVPCPAISLPLVVDCFGLDL